MATIHSYESTTPMQAVGVLGMNSGNLCAVAKCQYKYRCFFS